MQPFGAGGIDIAVAMAGGAFHIPTPKVRGIRLTGRLPKGCSAKDVILKVLEKYGTKGNVGWIFEYFGPGVKTLDVPSRATIANMGAELGVTTSVFPSDAVTRQFLAAQGRADDWTELVADRGAAYDDVFEVKLDALEPLMAAPHSPGNVVTVKAMKGTKVNQILIGSCTNGSYRDIRTVALYGVIMAGIGIIGRYWLLPLLETALPSASAANCSACFGVLCAEMILVSYSTPKFSSICSAFWTTG